MRGIDDCQPCQPEIGPKRGTPGDRSTPIVADQVETFEGQRIGERKDIVDQGVGLVGADVLRPVGSSKAALIRHDEEELVF